MQSLDEIFQVFLAILLAFIIYFVSFSALVYNQNFYNSLFEKTSVDLNEAQELTKEVFSYFRNNDDSVPQIKTLTQDENSHLKDVKVVIQSVFTVFYFVILLCAIGLWRVKNKQKLFFYCGVLGMLVPLLLWLVNFPKIFTIFHKVFFPQGNWIFPATATLVNVYTFEFFKLFALQILAIGEFLSFMVIVGSLVVKASKLWPPKPKTF